MTDKKYSQPTERSLWQKVKFSMNSPYAENPGSIILRRVRGQIYLDTHGDVGATVFMAGTGRSGTTWLSRVINYNNDYRYIHEPFHPARVPQVAHFQNGQYLRTDNTSRKYLDPIDKILTGRIRGAWVDRYNQKMLPNKRLIKAVRANLMVRWLHDRYPELPIVFMIRHPLAVTNSKLTRNWPPRLDLYLQQEMLLEDYLAPFVADMKAAIDDFEKHVFAWCIENYVPLCQMRKGEIHFMLYEELFSNPEKEVSRLFGYLGMPYTDKVFSRVKAPSPTSRKESAILKGGDVLSGWQKNFSSDQINRAIDILALFGLDKIYSKQKEPNIFLQDIPNGAFFLEK